MSKRNYSNYSKKNETPVEEVTAEAVEVTETEPVVVVNEAPEIKIIEETVETVAVPETVKGIVANCSKLNIRDKAKVTTEVVTVVNAGAELVIDVEKSTKDWFKVCTSNGIEGYCMRKFVNAKL